MFTGPFQAGKETCASTARRTATAFFALGVVLAACGKERPFAEEAPTSPDMTAPAGTPGSEPASAGGAVEACSTPPCSSNPEQVEPVGGIMGAADDTEDVSGANAENAECTDGATESCGPPAEEGICRFGTRTCAAGVWGECTGAVLAGVRDCTSAEDNDCDGQPDNTIDDTCRCPASATQPCDEHPGLDGRGPCRAGVQTCVVAPDNATSSFGECTGAVAPQLADSCEVQSDDADCDGIPNGGCTCVEGTTIECGPDTDLGICVRGTSTCTNGAFTECVGAVFPTRRDCTSAEDNDCDGLPDNTIDATCACLVGETRACGAHPGRDGNGICRVGQQTCLAGAQGTTSSFGACLGSVGPALRDSCLVPNDDADCDGLLNDGCQCVAGQGNAPCSGDPRNARCDGLGQCVPCQFDADCASVSGGRNICSLGVCVAERCGDGLASPGEQCDDGNLVGGDGCSVSCTLELNDGSACVLDTDCASGTCLDHYLDEDGDGFAPIQEASRPRRLCSSGEAVVPQTTIRRPSGFAADTDCCDSDPLSNALFTSVENDPNACGNFDWDCDGVEELFYPNALVQPCNLIVVPALCNGTRLAPGGAELCGTEIQLTDCRFIEGLGCEVFTVTGGRDVQLCN